MSEWKEGTLTEIAEIIMGQSPKGVSCNQTGCGKPLLNGPTEFGVKYPDPVQYTDEPTKLSKDGDILFCVRGSTTGRMNWSDQEYVLGRGLAAIRHVQGKDYQYFVKGLIEYNLPFLLASATGSTFPNVSRDQLENLEILIPAFPEQKAIASVLSSLDDKIDLLHRQNKTLEAMAETLFRKWFVEDAKDDWEEMSLVEIIQVIGGGTPKTTIQEYWNGEIFWLSGGDIALNHKSFIISTEKTITEAGLNNSSAKLLPKYATVISARGTVGKYGILSKPMAFSQSNYGILPKYGTCFFFTYLLINSVVAELKSSAHGSVFDTITIKTFKEKIVLIPSNDEIEKFEEAISPYFQKMFTNELQIRTLEKLRDTLLPKLMSGELRIKYEDKRGYD